jgi:hypothetical protein
VLDTRLLEVLEAGNIGSRELRAGNRKAGSAWELGILEAGSRKASN